MILEGKKLFLAAGPGVEVPVAPPRGKGRMCDMLYQRQGVE